MNRYWLFAGFNHYPRAGMSDFRGDKVTIDGCLELFKIVSEQELSSLGSKLQWYQVVDSHNGNIVKQFGEPHGGHC